MTQEPIVHTDKGTVAGFWRNESAAFLGIPFAEPPVGERRFQAPVPRTPWEGTRQCVDYAPTEQRRQLVEVTAIPEPSIPGDDTLCLNVFTPAPGDSSAKLPVYVWIHGGGYTAGSPASPWYDGAAFNRDGVVTVTLAYRLGFDGFGWIEDAPMNRGVLDWIAGLEWVAANIEQFGGNPEDVTIGGQSAGGGAVLTLLAMPKAQHLFQRVISHSGAAADIPMAKAEETSRLLCSALGVEPTVASVSVCTPDQILDEQDALSAKAMSAFGNPMDGLKALLHGESSMLGFGPVVDGDLVEFTVPEALDRGIGADKALLMGTVANEFNMITASAPAAVNLMPKKSILKKAGLSSLFAKEYVEARHGMDTKGVIGQLMTDAMFRVPLTRYAARTASAGTWVFDFRWVSPLSKSTPHCLDLPFAWDCLADDHVATVNTGPNPPQALADAMHGAWVRFIANGDPGWSRYQAPGFPGEVLDTSSYEADGIYGIERALGQQLAGEKVAVG